MFFQVLGVVQDAQQQAARLELLVRVEARDGGARADDLVQPLAVPAEAVVVVEEDERVLPAAPGVRIILLVL